MYSLLHANQPDVTHHDTTFKAKGYHKVTNLCNGIFMVRHSLMYRSYQ